ncbi:hypothetical protein [Polynucleobacter corsicus]|uniref:hypothetical protein n=1 Tax=Polynucleobacter corsicus TaxID=2081042 RepID=UPI001BFE8659|nr:hypothetical protein [Polynucleobacter corsicus]QWE19490.1 hypothetical protein C2747_04550 [Polynucleobacter corsicus]
MKKTIFIKKVLLPKKSLFQDLIVQLLPQINALTGRKNTPSASTKQKRIFAAKLVIEGLYRCFCSHSYGISLAVPHHSNAYKSGDENKINQVGYRVILSVIDAMDALGWVDRVMGYRTSEDAGETTELRPSGALLEEFKKVGIAWQEMDLISDVIVRRNYDEETKKKYKQNIPKSDVVRSMGANLRKINKFLSKQCICLMIANENFQRLDGEMTFGQRKTLYDFKYEGKFPRYLDLTMVQLRRIFSRNSMKLGGRFYGGWWQFIPKKYRVHITINFMPTREVDYSGLHPYMMYHLDNLPPPEGDMYDIGIWKTDAERARKRPIVKEFFNAIVNDEYGEYQLAKEDKKILGLSNKQLREKLAHKHHLISHRFNSGYGLTLQYEDSKIAERVMLILLKQGIACLPMHDSFIVQAIEGAKVIAAMNQSYKERFGIEIDLKSTFLFDSDEQGKRKHSIQLPLQIDKNGVVDRAALYKMHSENLHNQFCISWQRKVLGT